MYIIAEPDALARAMDSPLPEPVRRLLTLRADLIDIATFLIPEAGDALQQLEEAAGTQLASSLTDGAPWGGESFLPGFEWSLDHGGAFELPYILSDDGAGVVLIVADDDGIEPTLLAMARHFAQPAEAEDEYDAEPSVQ